MTNPKSVSELKETTSQTDNDVDLQKKQPSKQSSLHCQACFVLKYNCFGRVLLLSTSICRNVGVHMNVVPRSTKNTNGGTEN